MEALFTTFLAAGLAEWGDKTQWLAAALAVRHGRPLPVLAGAALGILVNALLAAFGGILIHDMIVPRAASLLVAVALLFAGIGGLIDRRPAGEAAEWPGGAAVAAAIAVSVTEFGDKTQFLTAALAAQYDSLLLAAIGATLGATAALVPAVILGHRLPGLLPLKLMRRGIACALLLTGFLVAIKALRLI